MGHREPRLSRQLPTWLQEELKSACPYCFLSTKIRSQKISVSVRMLKWILSCLEEKGLLEVGVLAFDTTHTGAGLCSRYVVGSAWKGEVLTFGQTLMASSAQSSRPTAFPKHQTGTGVCGIQPWVLLELGTPRCAQAPAVRAAVLAGRDRAGTAQGPRLHHYKFLHYHFLQNYSFVSSYPGRHHPTKRSVQQHQSHPRPD